MSLEVGLLLESTTQQWKKIKSMDKTPTLLLELAELEAVVLTKSWHTDAEELRKLNQDIVSLQKDITDFQLLEQQMNQIIELFELLSVESDEEMLQDLKIDIQQLSLNLTQRELTLLLNDKFDRSNCYLSINAGAGGTESNDWALMLFRMYKRWAEDKNFSIQIVDELPGEEVGIKNITILVQGTYCYGYLKGEQGVHRLVRISPFDANKKRHTSFASVSVYPEMIEDIDIPIQTNDLRIDTFRASGAGGQHVNKTDSAVRIVHIPTGITVTSQQERSQHKNKDTAMKILKSKLYSYYQEKKSEELQYLKSDKKEISWGSQIRSYVFQPYKLIKDNRTGLEIGNVDKVMDGYLDPLLFEYLKWQYTKNI